MKSALRSRADNTTLRFNEDGSFRISVFSDLHFAENATRDSMTQNVMAGILSEEPSDLVVLNGDLISGEATNGDDSGTYLHQVVSPLVNAGKTWTSTYGNHDSDVNLDPMKDIFHQENQYSNSLTQSMISSTDAGITNYFLPVYSHNTSDHTPSLILWFFDSKGGHLPQNQTTDEDPVVRGDWVDESVVEWFTSTNRNLTEHYGRALPSLAFYHIPAHAMFQYQEEGVDEDTTPGINGETVVSQGSGDTDYAGQDHRFMRALLNTSGLMATFSGHDHDNDWCFKWNKTSDESHPGEQIDMCYGRHSGYGGYGDAARGSRQILLNSSNIERGLRTWIRLEDGTISAPVHLNSTYGQDKYAPVSRERSQSSNTSRVDDPSFLLFFVYLLIAVLSLRHLGSS